MTFSDRMPRRRLGVEERRAAILDAARAEFARAGFSNVSLGAIARSAQASEALVLRYFGTKAALYETVAREHGAALVAKQDAAVAALPAAATLAERLELTIEIYLDFVQSAPRAWAAVSAHPFDAPAGIADMQRTIRAGYLDDFVARVDADRTPALERAFLGYLAFVDGVCATWVAEGCPRSARASIIAQSIGALRGALAAIDVTLAR